MRQFWVVIRVVNKGALLWCLVRVVKKRQFCVVLSDG